MKKYKRYQDYVIKDGKFIGEFEEMYNDFDDPWEQSKEALMPEKNIALSHIKGFKRNRRLELGCGFGIFTNEINQVSENTAGYDISLTAINEAKKRYPDIDFQVSKFPDVTSIREYNPDCIIMSELSWYVLDELDSFKDFLHSLANNL